MHSRLLAKEARQIWGSISGAGSIALGKKTHCRERCECHQGGSAGSSGGTDNTYLEKVQENDPPRDLVKPFGHVTWPTLR